MEGTAVSESLLDGRRAMEAAEWEAARDAFLRVLSDRDDPDAHEGLGQALWFLGEIREGIAARERAFEGYVAARRCDDAARVAVWVSHQNATLGRSSAARGWLARAERAIEEAGITCAGRGWVAVEHARQSPDVEEQIESARTALSIARATGEGNLEVFALSLLGRATVSAGRAEEGMRLLEEAMAAASAGLARNLHTVAEAYCNLITASTAAGDWERASEWCELVDEFAREHQTAPLLGACRTIHADVLLAAGRWPEAERALESALATHARYIPQMDAPTVATMAELRIRQGRLREAEALLQGREENPASLRSLALLKFAMGRPSVAAALLERGLLDVGEDAIRATQLLAPLVDARLEQSDVAGAAVAAERLAELAEGTGLRLVAARSDLALARIAAREGRSRDAVEHSRRALKSFSALAMPYDAAEARVELARALSAESPELAREEARAAVEVFRRLGAGRARDAAVGVLRGLGDSSGASRPRTGGDLTVREREVLDLLGLGMSNAAIAQTLVISEKTAGHHVSRILMKLGVSNRAQAAAHAIRAAGEDP